MKRLLERVRARRVDVIVIYKIDRLTRSLTDFAKLAEEFDQYGVSFVSVTQQFNTTTSMGRLMLNVLLSFAQFEREIAGERIRDKIAASKKKGMWMGGSVPLGYDWKDRRWSSTRLRQKRPVITLFRLYLKHGNVRTVVVTEASRLGLKNKGTNERVRTDGRAAMLSDEGTSMPSSEIRFMSAVFPMAGRATRHHILRSSRKRCGARFKTG